MVSTIETITTRSGWPLRVETSTSGDEITVSLQIPTLRRCLLHWGVRTRREDPWLRPPSSLWPPETQPFGPIAVQTPLVQDQGASSVVLHVRPPTAWSGIDFVLYFPDEKRWDNNEGRNYQIAWSAKEQSRESPLQVLRAQTASEERIFERAFDLEGPGQLAVAVTKTGDRFRVSLLTDLAGPWLLHWGLAQRSPQEWQLPPESLRAPGTSISPEGSAQTPLAAQADLNALRLEFPVTEAPVGIQFVLRQGGQGGRWLKHRGGNFFVPVQPVQPRTTVPGPGPFAGLADEIVRAETTHNSWTLMHRFNLAHDLLDRVRHSVEGMAAVFVWLRYSAIRQLTWQRNFNTKPRELTHAQDRLTRKLAEVFREHPAGRPLVRLALATVGRGGEGQQIRDEILNIMHRHHVKEVSGHFLEEWHQKLHNNTTPDDIVICEAYLEFLRSHGNADRFYQVLQAGGVTRQRLESFERPIRSPPQFVPHLKDGLIHDFQNFLRILKAIHSGTDLETAIQAARSQLEAPLQGLMHYLWEHRQDPPASLVPLVNQLTEARRQLMPRLCRNDSTRELLYLDLALEQLLRGAVERNIHLPLSGDQWVDLIGSVLQNVTLSSEDPELAACSRHWSRLQSRPRFGAEWSLQAKSVTDRMARALSAWIDRFYQLLQPLAEYLGHGFQAEPWTITLFSEEVVRGSSLGFVLSLLLHHLDPLLRQSAHLGPWQIISRGRGAGTVEVVDTLRSIQRRTFDRPTVIVADSVMGDEEIPEGVTAVIAPDVTDIVSHVAVRARNAGILFAACHEIALRQHLKSLQGHHLELEVNAAGDVVVRESTADVMALSSPRRLTGTSVTPRRFTQYAVGFEDFTESIVGGKSVHQTRLRGPLPDWIHQPPSVALPFGVMEQVLGLDFNRAVAQRLAELTRPAAGDTPEALAAVREAVLTLAAPDELKAALHRAMTRAGLAWPEDWERTWHCIKQVWASKWNERAVLSRKKMGIPPENLFMAVLIQSVAPADYAFVIHTVNPSTGKKELFAEVVLGLGETLVGNYPGRALSFTSDQTTGQQTLLSFPSKDIALYGRGLIFRSDSNGEDLAGFAGAGLYDSVLLEPPKSVVVDYSQEPLLWDEDFRRRLLTGISRIGLEVERICGSPQDIEGVMAQGQYYLVQTRPQVGVD